MILQAYNHDLLVFPYATRIAIPNPYRSPCKGEWTTLQLLWKRIAFRIFKTSDAAWLVTLFDVMSGICFGTQ